MKNKEIVSFREALNEVDYIRNKTFAYAVFKNKDLLDKEVETGEIDYEQMREGARHLC